MIKRILPIFLVVIILFSLSPCSFASDTDKYDWLAVKDHITDLFGTSALDGYVDEVDADFCLPDFFSPVALTDQDIADGYIGFLVSNDRESYVLFNYTDMAGSSLSSLHDYYVQNGYNAEMISVNGIPALLQRDFNNNVLLLNYQTQENRLFQLIFSPLSAEETLYNYIIASIRPHADEKGASESEVAVSVNPVSGLISK